MNFILKMAWRDSRASRRRLLLFSLSVVLGIAALVAIGSLGANLSRAIDDQAKGLLGADLIITGRAEPSEPVMQYVRALGGEHAREISFSSMMTFPSMRNLTRLINVRALEGNFPYFGDFDTDPIDAPAKFRAGGNVAIVEETLLRQYNTKVGETVRLGNSTFTVVGALRKLPGEATAISATAAPRALIPMSALAATGLGENNLLIRYRTILKLPAGQDALLVENQMRGQFRGERLGFDTVAERKRDLGRALENIEGFLSLVGFISLFLGGIGVASAIHSYIQQKINTVAVLRCLGASARQSFAVYLVQGIALGLFGAVLGVLLGVAIQFGFLLLLNTMSPYELTFFLAWPALLGGMIAGLLICVLFTMLPLLRVRRVSPLVAIRSAVAQTGTGTDPWAIVIGAFILASVTGFSIWQTGETDKGLGFTGMLLLGFAILGGAAKFVSWSARKWFPKGGLPYVVRQGVANLYRPNNRTVLLLLSLGLGTFLMLTLFLARTTLLNEIEFSGGGNRPNLLFLDVQDDQIDGIKKITSDNGTPLLVHAPIVTMKIAGVKGRPVEELLRNVGGRGGRGPEMPPPKAEPSGSGQNNPPDRLPGWTLRREYRSTYRAQMESAERLVAGTFIGRMPPGTDVIPISIEERLFTDMGLKLGDEIEWDIQGVRMRTQVSSVRAVEWRRLEPNFFVVFPEGSLDGAPKFHVAALRAETSELSAQVQRAVIEAYPSVTAIDLALVMETVDSVFSKLSLAIQIMALFTVVTGVVVLIGAVLTGRFQRIRETVLLRTLGATHRQLLQIQFVEYAILGVLAAIVGCGLAVLGNALVAKYIFNLTPVAPPLLLLAATGAVCAVTVITGLLTSRGITNHPPLEVLRQET